jgi:hypothetical protein
MPQFTENHALLRFGGPGFGGEEIWSCGLRLRHVGGDALDPMRADTIASLPDVTGAVLDYTNDVNASFNGLCSVAWVKLDVIRATTGKYAFPDNPNTFELPAPDPCAGPPGPPQVAYCVTNRGLFKRGPAARGRWYVPVGAAGVDSQGRISDANAQAFADAAGSFLTALRDIETGEGPNTWTPWLYGDGISGSRDSVYVSTSVGNVYDTQRRRRNALEEEYFLATNYPA